MVELGDLGLHLIHSLAGIFEPPQFALPRASKSLRQAPFVLGAALADIQAEAVVAEEATAAERCIQEICHRLVPIPTGTLHVESEGPNRWVEYQAMKEEKFGSKRAGCIHTH